MRVGEAAERDGRPGATAGSTLHVTNGDSAGHTLERTTLGGRVLSWQDVLHEGPVPDVPRRQLHRVRAEFLSACGWGSKTALFRSLERRDDELVAALRDRRHVVLWFEHDLFDQLQLLQILSAAAETGFEASRLELVVVGAFPGRASFHGLGELSASELETLWQGRVQSTAELAAAAHEAWSAVRAPDPTRLAEVASVALPGLPHLAPALRRLLEELPAVADGLSRTERQALHVLSAGPRELNDVFRLAQAEEEAPFLGDTWFFRALGELGRPAQRLVETVTGEPVPEPPPLGEPAGYGQVQVQLTERGRAVLAGDADRIELLGIDRWLLGTHITRAAVWRWDSASLTVIATS